MNAIRQEFAGGNTQSSKYQDEINLVIGIKAGDESALLQFYDFLQTRRHVFFRSFNTADQDDLIQDTFLTVVETIKKGGLDDPARLMGLVKTIASRQAAAFIGELAKERTRYAPMDDVGVIGKLIVFQDHSKDRLDFFNQVMECNDPKAFRARERELLHRFYFLAQDDLEIQKEMNLSEKQYSLLKWRAKAHFIAVGQQLLNPSISTKYKRGTGSFEPQTLVA